MHFIVARRHALRSAALPASDTKLSTALLRSCRAMGVLGLQASVHTGVVGGEPASEVATAEPVAITTYSHDIRQA